MEAAKYLEVIGCDFHKPSRFQVNYQLVHNGKRYDFINGLVLSNWTVYHPNDKDTPGTVFEFNEIEMKNYIYKNFIEELRDTQIDKILK